MKRLEMPGVLWRFAPLCLKNVFGNCDVCGINRSVHFPGKSVFACWQKGQIRREFPANLLPKLPPNWIMADRNSIFQADEFQRIPKSLRIRAQSGAVKHVHERFHGCTGPAAISRTLGPFPSAVQQWVLSGLQDRSFRKLQRLRPGNQDPPWSGGKHWRTSFLLLLRLHESDPQFALFAQLDWSLAARGPSNELKLLFLTTTYLALSAQFLSFTDTEQNLLKWKNIGIVFFWLNSQGKKVFCYFSHKPPLSYKAQLYLLSRRTSCQIQTGQDTQKFTNAQTENKTRLSLLNGAE